MLKEMFMLCLLVSSVCIAELKTEFKANIVNRKGVMKEGESGKPGEKILYTFTLINDTESMQKVNPVIPIPEGTTLLPTSVKPKDYVVSLDGINFVKHPIKDKDGNDISDSLYRAIKWEVDTLKKNEKLMTSVEVEINVAR